jgi:orotidine-5'-phosphate decarboxylase
MQNPIIVALDVDTREKALKLAEELEGKVAAFKVGLELFNSAGVPVIEAIQSKGIPVFYDAKFHDIPNTVKGAVAAATKMGVWMVNVHCTGGLEMMKAARESANETAAKLGSKTPLVIGVTVLTSISQEILNTQWGVSGNVGDTVLRLASLAKEAGLDGVVCSGHEIELLKRELGKEFKLIVPGIRPADSGSVQDQKRVMTPGQAVSLGADYLVIGRPITKAPVPAEAAAKILNEIK